MDKLIDEIRSIRNEAYIKQLNVKCLHNKRMEELLTIKPENIKFSTRARITTGWPEMRSFHLSTKSDITACCFRAKAGTLNAVYAYVFLHLHTGDHGPVHPPAIKDDDNCADGSGDIQMLFLAAGPTYTSMDGEYRRRVIRWNQYVRLVKEFSSVFAQVEELVCGKLNRGDISLHADFCFPPAIKKADQKRIQDYINCERFAIHLYSVAWICDNLAIRTGTIENHINPAYQAIIFGDEHDTEVYQKINGDKDLDVYLLVHYCSSTMPSTEEIRRIINTNKVTQKYSSDGIKIFPLSQYDVDNIDSITCNVWREMFATKRASDLVLNLITPSCPSVNGWFYMRGIHERVFDNPSMYDRFDQSRLAKEMAERIRTLRLAAYIDKDSVKGVRSRKFGKLDDLLRKAQRFARSDIVLTDIALVLHTEYLYRTMRDIPASLSVPYLKDMFTNIELFKKIMFDYVYSFYCINTHLHMIHADAHLNNVTVFNYLHSARMSELPDGHVVFIIDKQVYAFKYHGLIGCLIDFSRSIFSAAGLVNHYDKPTIESYLLGQQSRINDLLQLHFPQYYKANSQKLSSLISNNFPLAFKILTVIDSYVLYSSMLAMLDTEELLRGKCEPSVYKLTKDLSTKAGMLLIDNFNSAFSGKVKYPDDIEWPNMILIADCFAANKVDFESPGELNVLDLFNCNNKLNYTVEDPSRWGPLMSYELVEGIFKKHGVPPTEDLELYRYMFELNEKEEIDLSPPDDSWMLD